MALRHLPGLMPLQAVREENKENMDNFYESPYRYNSRTSIYWKHPEQPCSASQISEKLCDSTLSGIDLAIMEILYRLHYAARRTIEAELEGMEVRKPKDLKRTLKHLIEEGVISGFASAEDDRNKNIRFYCLTDGAIQFMAKQGAMTEFPYQPSISGRDVCALLAYNQLYGCLMSTLEGKPVIKDCRQYQMYGINGVLVVDGYIELMREEQAECLYIHVVRSEKGWHIHTAEFYSALVRYTQGIANTTVLFLCEDSAQVLELSNYLDERFPTDSPKRYYTYDTLVFADQLSQRVIACDGSSLVYGSLIL